jgi:hypothetical protein
MKKIFLPAFIIANVGYSQDSLGLYDELNSSPSTDYIIRNNDSQSNITFTSTYSEDSPVSTGEQLTNESFAWGIEIVHRHASVPYFAGRGGLTSPNGWNAPIGDPSGFIADLVKDETRLIFSMIFHI